MMAGVGVTGFVQAEWRRQRKRCGCDLYEYGGRCKKSFFAKEQGPAKDHY